jgi:mRNA interferase HicA
MKRRDLERHLREHGCVFLEHGARHDTWVNPTNGLQSSVPRHTEVRKTGTVRAICRELGIPAPRLK